MLSFMLTRYVVLCRFCLNVAVCDLSHHANHSVLQDASEYLCQAHDEWIEEVLRHTTGKRKGVGGPPQPHPPPPPHLISLDSAPTCDTITLPPPPVKGR